MFPVLYPDFHLLHQLVTVSDKHSGTNKRDTKVTNWKLFFYKTHQVRDVGLQSCINLAVEYRAFLRIWDQARHRLELLQRVFDHLDCLNAPMTENQ